MKKITIMLSMLLIIWGLTGCSKENNMAAEEKNPENVIITETGEVLAKENEGGEGTEEAPSPSPERVVLEEPLEEPEVEQVITEHDNYKPEEEPELQIVFLGDSILDGYRNETGIAYLTGAALNADVYNLAIGGTSASDETGIDLSYENWSSRSLIGVLNVLAGKVSPDFLKGYRSAEVMETLDVSKTDYFVVSYGLNDFFRGVKQSNPDRTYDTTTYSGALRTAVELMRTLAPDAEIILCAPNYAQFFVDGRFIGDGNVVDNGNGTLFDYKGTCEYVSGERGTLFLDAYLALGIDGYTAEEYLEDGVHLSAAGRKIYAEALTRIIMRSKGTYVEEPEEE